MEFGRLKNFINGEWRDSDSNETLDIINPALDEIIAEVPISTEEEVNEAVMAAKEAFPEWRKTPPVSRARYLLSQSAHASGGASLRNPHPSSELWCTHRAHGADPVGDGRALWEP